MLDSKQFSSLCVNLSLKRSFSSSNVRHLLCSAMMSRRVCSFELYAILSLIALFSTVRRSSESFTLSSAISIRYFSPSRRASSKASVRSSARFLSTNITLFSSLISASRAFNLALISKL